MEKKKTHDTSTVTCRRCGKCCLSPLVPATEDDMDRWRLEERQEMLRAVELSRAVWAGDLVVSSEDGEILSNCPFLRYEEECYSCAIYDDKPRVCRQFKPGASELCSQFKGTR